MPQSSTSPAASSKRRKKVVPPPVRTRTVALHGHRVCFREAGTPGAPLVLLLHGIAGSSETWEPVLERLGRSLHEAARHHDEPVDDAGAPTVAATPPTRRQKRSAS